MLFRSLRPVIPQDFPFTTRVSAEVLESAGTVVLLFSVLQEQVTLTSCQCNFKGSKDAENVLFLAFLVCVSMCEIPK